MMPPPANRLMRADQRTAQRQLGGRERSVPSQARDHQHQQRNAGHAAVAHQGREIHDVIHRGHRETVDPRHRRERYHGQREQHGVQPRPAPQARARGPQQQHRGDQHQYRVRELQHMATAPEKQVEVVFARSARRHAAVADRHAGDREQRAQRRESECEADHFVLVARVHAAQEYQQIASGLYHQAGRDRREPRIEPRMLQHRHVVVHQRAPGAHEGRDADHHGADHRERDRGAAGRARGRAAVQAPQHAGTRDEPHQYREIHVRHQRDPEPLRSGYHVVDERGSRQCEQQRQQAGGQQRVDAEPDPREYGRRWRTVGLAHGLRDVQAGQVAGFRLVHALLPGYRRRHSASSRRMVATISLVVAVLANVARTRPSRSSR